MFMQLILLLTSLVSFVYAVPLALRDVVDPPITSPTAATIWHVGDTQTVTWSTAGLPSNPSNPNGMLVLGYMANDSENLMLDSPLATNLSYAVGQAEITVPNVPTGSNYIVVLFGDSGNASPQFTITNDASSSAAPTSASPTITTPSSSPATSPPVAAGSSPSGNSSPLPTTGSVTATTTTTTNSSPSSTVVTATISITPSPAQTGAAWQKHASGVGTSVSVVLALLYFVF
ncbi:hypothetical protein PAXINDRAFT_167837 [Paxillus involutus ATCC 200175]|nr:hypothetical protein PAXINDRAFT_167837 [Paxillus involutus ATCC 200175]